MTKRYFVIFLLTLYWINSFGQEVLGGLPYNPILTNIDVVDKNQKKSSILLKLPFFDDFSNNSIFPDASLWEEDGGYDVFINNSYGRGIVSAGVATFDAVNQNGIFTASASTSPFLSDQLKSYPIDLSDADMNSLWISFYYQPQGYGNAPEKNDSLILQVSVGDGIWDNLWYSTGMKFDYFRENVLLLNPLLEGEMLEFDYVLVKIDSLKYKSPNFKFRFINYASLSADHNASAAVNCDHWNIDYVYLNDGRDTSKSGLFDVACIEPPRLFLRDFESVPWTHYTEVQRSELAKKDLLVRNNDTEGRVAERVELLINDLDTDELLKATYLASWDVDPLETENYPWKYDADPLFEVTAVDNLHFKYQLKLTIDDSVPQNNIVSRDYHFTNYYAYDDGTAENTYGVDANGAKVAYRFKSYIPDTLKGVSINFFETHPSGAGATSFSLCVWDDDNGKPGELLYVEDTVPIFYSSLNKPHEYDLSTPVPIDGDFYIGWQQKSELRLNVGFDMNRNSEENIFYNIFGAWENTSFNGSLLMRPLIGHLKPNAIKTNRSVTNELTVFPNPASSNIFFSGIESENIKAIRIFNSIGKIVYQVNLQQENLDVKFLDNGIYLLSIIDENNLPYTSRFIISK